MKKYIPVLNKTKIFSGLSEKETESMLSCLDARVLQFKKGEYVLNCGEYLSELPLLVRGSLHIQNDDYWGNRSILGMVSVGEMFGEAYAISQNTALRVDVVALEDSAVIFLNINKIIISCPSSCSFHSAVTKNLFLALSEKNRSLVQKIGHMSKRTTRDKLISYLSAEAKKNKSSYFKTPFNRQQLADFLCVDRSAMSNELCKMRDEGLLEFERSTFKLLKVIK